MAVSKGLTVMTRTVRMTDLNWVDYARRIADESPVLFLPVGAIEQHGHHLPMDCDVVIPDALSVRVAQRVGGLVAPPIVYGYKSQPRIGGGNHFPGTTSLDGGTMIGVARDLIREFARHGVRKLVMMDAHYENTMFLIEGIDLALRDLRAQGIVDLKVMRVAYFQFTSHATIEKVWPDGFSGWALEHAGVMETSAMLFLDPDRVHMERLAEHPPASFPPYDVYPVTHENVPGVPSSGALMSAKAATREKGELLVEEWTRGIADAVTHEFRTAVRLPTAARHGQAVSTL
jgi:creatinine amidohydrolase